MVSIVLHEFEKFALYLKRNANCKEASSGDMMCPPPSRQRCNISIVYCPKSSGM